MYKLFYYPRNASWAPHLLLTEMGVDFDLVLVDRKSNAQKDAEYLKLNPTGRIPTLAFGNKIIYESAAICLFLCEQHPEKNMIPPAGSFERAKFYQWLFYLNASLQPELMIYFYPQKHTLENIGIAQIRAAQENRVIEMLGHIDKELEAKDYLVGDHITACDFVLFMLSHWASGLNTPPISMPNLGGYLKRLAKRDSVRRVCEIESTSLSMYS